MAEGGRRLPVAFGERSIAMRAVLVLVVPLVFGVIAGAVLSPLLVVYLVLQIVAVLGGLFAGLEHRQLSEATIRGLAAGMCFGLAILVTHVLLGGDDHGLLGADPLLLPFFTGLFGVVFAIVGSLIRRALER